MAIDIDTPPPIGLPEFGRVPTGQAGEVSDLMLATAQGDRAAFTRLHDLFAVRVLATARSVARDPTMAQDIRQDVFLEIWRTAARFDPEKGSAVAWIIRLTRSRAIDRVRHSESSRRRDTSYAAHHNDRDSDTVTDAVLDILDQRHIHASLTLLTAGQLEAVTLVYFTGHTHLQASTLLGIPLPTFKSRIRDAIIKLRRAAA